jgi:hypothetical protein
METDLQVAIIPPCYLIRQEYLEESGIVQLVSPGQGQSFRQGIEQIAQPETLE